MATQTDEFGTRSGSSRAVVLCAARPLLDRVLPDPRSAADDLRLVRAEARRAGRDPSDGRPRAGRHRRPRAEVGVYTVKGSGRAGAAPDGRRPEPCVAPGRPGRFRPSRSSRTSAPSTSRCSAQGPQLVLTMAEPHAGERGPPSRGRSILTQSITATGWWRDAGSSPAGGRDRDHHARVVRVRHGRVARRAIRAANGLSVGLDSRGVTGNLRLRRRAAGADDVTVRRCSSSGAPPVDAGSTWRCCRRRAAADRGRPEDHGQR